MIHTHTCKNGLRIVQESIPTVRSVTMGIWVLTGSRYEKEETNGISHFLEHMLFKGTKKRSALQIAEAFDAIGGYVNAFTSKEYTCYFAQVLDTYKEVALDVLTDMFFESTFPEDELIREKKVVREEIKMYDDAPDDLVHELLARAVYQNQALGRPILGMEEQINQFTKATLLEHLQQFYTPKNVVVSIAGNVDESFIDEVEKYFDRFDYPDQKMNLKKPEFTFEHLHKNKETEQVHICLGYEGLPVSHQEIPSMMVMNNVLGGSMSSRLFQEIREKRGLAYSVFSYHSAYLDSGYLVIYAGTTESQLQILRDSIDQTIEKLIEYGLTDKELKNSKAQLKGNMMLRLEGTNSRMSRNGRNELLLNQHKTLDEVIKEVDQVTQEQMQKTILQTFTNRRAKALITPYNS